MTSKLLSLLAAGAIVALAGTAHAGQLLSNKQLDGVTAGGVAIGNAGALALGEVDAVTFTQTSTDVVTVVPGKIAVGQAFSQALATGGFLFQAAAISHVDTAASLP